MKITFNDNEVKKIAKDYFNNYTDVLEYWLNENNKAFTQDELFEVEDFYCNLFDLDDPSDVYLTSDQKKIIYDIYLERVNKHIQKYIKADNLRDEIDEVLKKYGYATTDDIELDDGVIYIEEI